MMCSFFYENKRDSAKRGAHFMCQNLCYCLMSLWCLLRSCLIFISYLFWQRVRSPPPVSSRARLHPSSLRAPCPAVWRWGAAVHTAHAAGDHLYGRRRNTRVRNIGLCIFMSHSIHTLSFVCIHNYLNAVFGYIVFDLCFVRHGKH